MSLTYQSVDEVMRAYEARRARALAHCGGGGGEVRTAETLEARIPSWAMCWRASR